MRRRISLLLAAALASTTFMLFRPPQPASAAIVCAGAPGTLTVAPGLLFPVLVGFAATSGDKDHFIDILIFNRTQVIHGFAFGFGGNGACVHVRVPPTVGPFAGAGILTGYCGHSSGTGTVGGQPFSYVSAGIFLLLTGHVVGLATAVPLPIVTGSCLHADGPPTVNGSNPFRLPSGATAFTFTGAGVGLNCLNSLPPISTLITLPQDTLVLVDPKGVHLGQHVTHIWITQPCVPDALNHL